MENISKNVVCVEDKKVFGYVLDVALDDCDLNLIGYYIVENETESVFLVKLENVLSISDCVMISSSSSLQFVGEEVSSLIGKIVLDERGTSYGFVKTIVFEKNRVRKILTDKCEILQKHVKSYVGDFVFVCFSSKRKKRSKKVISNLDFVKKDSKYETLIFPEKVSLSSSYYLGKVSKNDIFGYNNERVVIKGELITKTIFENVKKHNKLNELFFCIN